MKDGCLCRQTLGDQDDGLLDARHRHRHRLGAIAVSDLGLLHVAVGRVKLLSRNTDDAGKVNRATEDDSIQTHDATTSARQGIGLSSHGGWTTGIHVYARVASTLISHP